MCLIWQGVPYREPCRNRPRRGPSARKPGGGTAGSLAGSPASQDPQCPAPASRSGPPGRPPPYPPPKQAHTPTHLSAMTQTLEALLGEIGRQSSISRSTASCTSQQ
jgi:hypothetical protein